MVSTKLSAGFSELCRLFQYGIHVERSAADLLGWAWQYRAGDRLKVASDLGVPVIGVALLYQQGYFRQVIDEDGAQQASSLQRLNPAPDDPLRRPNGEWLPVEIALPGFSVWLRAWEVRVGRSEALSIG